MKNHAIALALAIALGSISQLVLKSAFSSANAHGAHDGTGVVASLSRLAGKIAEFLQPWVGEINCFLLLLGLVLYVCSMLLWMISLQKFDLGKAYAFLGLSYVMVYLGSIFWPSLSETATLEKSIGVCLVVFGVTLISLGQGSAQDTPTPTPKES